MTDGSLSAACWCWRSPRRLLREPVPCLAATPARVSAFSSQAATNGFAGSLCPSHLRSTGIGWNLGSGRIGSVVGGALVGRGWSRLRLQARALNSAGSKPLETDLL